MKKFIVFVTVKKESDITYAVRIDCESAIAAEHFFLDKGICGISEYGCTNAFAVEVTKKEISTETFIGLILSSTTESIEKVCDLIEENNKEITKRDEAKRAIFKAKREKERAEKALEDARKALRDAVTALDEAENNYKTMAVA